MLNNLQKFLISVITSIACFGVGYYLGNKQANFKCDVARAKTIEATNKIVALNNANNLNLSLQMSNIQESSALKTQKLLHEKNKYIHELNTCHVNNKWLQLANASKARLSSSNSTALPIRTPTESSGVLSHMLEVNIINDELYLKCQNKLNGWNIWYNNWIKNAAK
jgi:hypothetical protein